MINGPRLSQIKLGVYLINTARGEVGDEHALAQDIWFDCIVGAGLDVFDGEPKIREELLGCDNAVLFLHLGSATKKTDEAMGLRVVENITDFFAGGEPRDLVA